MKSHLNFSGIYAILATPFDEKDEVDVESLRSLVHFEINAGVDGLTALAILGEVHKLSDTERTLVMNTILEVTNHRVPVIVGTGASGTHIAILYSKEAERLGADAVMVAPPHLLKPNDDAIVGYYSQIAKNINIPIIIQDEPLTYGVHFSPELIRKLCSIEGIGAIKLEDAPTLMKITQIRRIVEEEKLSIFGGLGGLYAFEELSRGACGLMTGFAFPEILSKIYKSYKTGNKREAQELFYKMLPIIRYEAQPLVGLAIRKEILRRRKAIRNSAIRSPGMKLDQEGLRELDDILGILGLTPEE